MLEILNNEEFNDPNIEIPKQPMKKRTKRLLVFGFAFLIAIYAIMSAAANMSKIYDGTLNQVKEYVNYLNEPFELSQIVTNPTTTQSNNSFVNKAREAGFGVFSSDGKVNLSKEKIDLNSPLTLTENELGSFVSKAITSEGVSFFNLLELTIFKEEPEPITQIITDPDSGEEREVIIENPIQTSILKMKTVFEINFLGVEEAIKSILPNFPQKVYITTVYDVVEGRDGKFIESKNGKQQINALDDEKNQKVLELLLYVFGDIKDVEDEITDDFSEISANSFLNIFVSIVSDTIEVVNDRTGGTFRFIPQDDDVVVRFLPSEE